jgi:hypothetical protein
MGLLDDMGPLLKGKPKIMPSPLTGFDATAPTAMTSGDELDPTMQARHAEALEVRGPAEPYVPGGTLAGPNQQRAFAAGDQPGAGFGPPSPPQARNLATAIADTEPPRAMAGMDFGLGDNFPGVKRPERLAEGLPMTAPDASPSMPTPGSGLLANVPLPPSRPAGLGGMPPTRSAAATPLPPPRPAGLGGATEVASTAAPPMPPIRPPGLGLEATGGMMASAPPIAPIAPPIAPIAPPIAPPTPAPQAPVGAAGGAMGGLGGLAGAIGAIAKGFGAGSKGPPPPQAKPPQITPSSAGPETSQQIAKASSQAPQILQGLLAQDKQDTLDPRKRRGLV